jgi:mycothiol synthase
MASHSTASLEYPLIAGPAAARLGPVTAFVGFRVRRVGFRAGTDEELAALHAVEAPVAAERGSNRMPQPVESYIALARNLPSQFSDHAWLVEASDGTPVACGFCWSNSAGDHQVMECDVLVRRDRRHQGIGSRLLAEICGETVNEGRSLLTWSTFGAVPAGEAFSRRVGARIARTNRTGELVLADVDWTMVQSWARAEPARDRGYRLEMVDGVFPAHLRADAVTFHHIMQTAPREDLDFGEVIVDAQFVAELDRALAEAGRTRWTVFVRDPTGVCVGGTEVTFEPWDPATVLQQNTGIDPSHRGLGLAKWAKAAILERVRHQRPQAVRVRTENASSNAPMLAINATLGFKIISTRTEWQADARELLHALR